MKNTIKYLTIKIHKTIKKMITTDETTRNRMILIRSLIHILQQGTAPVVQQLQTVPPKAPEYNAIKIDIVKPQVQTAQDPVYSMPFNSIYSYPDVYKRQVQRFRYILFK